MARFALFVDGPNLYGSLKSMNLEVKDHGAFFKYIFNASHSYWHKATQQTENSASELRRVYWYTIGSMDDWDLSLPQSQTSLRGAFSRDKIIRDLWSTLVFKDNPGLKGNSLDEKAWSECFDDIKIWYDQKKGALDGMKRFNQVLRSGNDLFDIIESGHWKVNFLHKWVEEKGLDTSLAVDMLALQDNYDVAVLITGDADSIPSIRHLKTKNKHIIVIEFVNGSPSDTKGKTFSSRLKEHADLVVRIYESDLIKIGIGKRVK